MTMERYLWGFFKGNCCMSERFTEH